jgi:hypothetical protein
MLYSLLLTALITLSVRSTKDSHHDVPYCNFNGGMLQSIDAEKDEILIFSVAWDGLNPNYHYLGFSCHLMPMSDPPVECPGMENLMVTH